ncbi:MAG TPA: GAF domain-containing protein [Terriglobales bacterium]|nr:GAF domain-containing protein [Terriglobales bacterium]
MAYVSLSLSPPSPEQGPSGSLPPENPTHDARHPEQIIAQLHAAITQRQLDVDASLQRISNLARLLTGASGIAIAMRRDGLVTCLSRSGETAPALGARLHVDSGISGECLLLARTLTCDDTEWDPRVDAEACRNLNVRSLVVVPLRTRQAVIGVLEAFFQEPRAFSEEHVQLLEKLGELSVIAQYCSMQIRATDDYDLPEATVQLQDSVLAAAGVITNPEPAAKALTDHWRWTSNRPLLIAVLVSMIMLAVLGWMLRDESNPEEASPAPAQAAAPGGTPSISVSPAATAQPDNALGITPSSGLVWDASTLSSTDPVPHAKRKALVNPAAAQTQFAGEKIIFRSEPGSESPTAVRQLAKPSAGLNPQPATTLQKVIVQNTPSPADRSAASNH